MNNKQRFNGIIPPTITPLLEDGTVDAAAVGNIVEHCIKGGVSGLFANGTSGEAMRITDTAWEQNMRLTLEHTAGRVPVFCGAIDSSTPRVMEKLKRIEAAGGKIAVCTTPFYLRSFGQEEILRHFEAICASTALDIAVYNIPETTQANILPETMARLADLDNVVAYKDSSADWQQLQRVLFLLEDKDVAVFNGAEELCSAAMLFGAQGCIPGLATFLPELFVQLHELCKAGEVHKSYELQKKIWRIRQCIFVSGCWMSSMKNLAAVFSLGGDGISAPLEKLTPPQQQQVLQILRENGVAV